jgi:hypothetical protein
MTIGKIMQVAGVALAGIIFFTVSGELKWVGLLGAGVAVAGHFFEFLKAALAKNVAVVEVKIKDKL